MITFDPERGRLIGPEGSIKLRIIDATILGMLAKDQGRIVSRVTLYQALYGERAEWHRPDFSIIGIHLTHLRKELRRVGLANAIRTHRGRGSELTVPISLIEHEDEGA